MGEMWARYGRDMGEIWARYVSRPCLSSGCSSQSYDGRGWRRGGVVAWWGVGGGAVALWRGGVVAWWHGGVAALHNAAHSAAESGFPRTGYSREGIFCDLT